MVSIREAVRVGLLLVEPGVLSSRLEAGGDAHRDNVTRQTALGDEVVTYGQAPANAVVASPHFVTAVDSSVSGLAGSSLAQSMQGNVAIDNLVRHLYEPGFETGRRCRVVASNGRSDGRATEST